MEKSKGIKNTAVHIWSNEEKEKIVDAGANLILQQMMNGCEEIELLAALNPSYKSNADFIKLKSIITQIKTSVDVDKIKEVNVKQWKVNGNNWQSLFNLLSGGSEKPGVLTRNSR